MATLYPYLDVLPNFLELERLEVVWTHIVGGIKGWPTLDATRCFTIFARLGCRLEGRIPWIP
jgi:hypothetical protein